MSKLKVGIIGVGSIARIHIEAYQKHPDVEVYAFCDINQKQLDKMGDQYGVDRRYTNLDEMLALDEIDAVSVCTWNCAHASCTIAALDAKKHVLCEKPMAMNVEEAKEMKEAAERNEKLLMIGFVRRHGNDCDTMKEFIESDFFGDIYYAKATYLRRNGNPCGWFGDLARSGGGPLIDLGVHVIDLVRYMNGNPKPVSVYGATFQKLGNRNELKDKKGYVSASATDHDTCDVEDLVSALIRFENGFVLDVEASFSLNIKGDIGKIELFGDKGGAKFDSELELYSIINDRMVDINFKNKITTGDFFTKELHHFVDCITTGIECIAPAQDGVEIMQILTAIYESARTGHEVILN